MAAKPSRFALLLASMSARSASVSCHPGALMPTVALGLTFTHILLE
jgi:hypothetical protein